MGNKLICVEPKPNETKEHLLELINDLVLIYLCTFSMFTLTLGLKKARVRLLFSEWWRITVYLANLILEPNHSSDLD